MGFKEEIEERTDQLLNEIADFIFTASQKNIVQKGAIDEGTLLKSGYVERNWLEKIIGYSAPYAGYVEFGTDPHMPPVQPLIDWSRRKLGLSEREARRVGWAIAKKIAKEGTEPRSFLRDAIDQAIAKYGGMIRETR